MSNFSAPQMALIGMYRLHPPQFHYLYLHTRSLDLFLPCRRLGCGPASRFDLLESATSATYRWPRLSSTVLSIRNTWVIFVLELFIYHTFAHFDHQLSTSRLTLYLHLLLVLSSNNAHTSPYCSLRSLIMNKQPSWGIYHANLPCSLSFVPKHMESS